jgi:hypothetical protein
MCSRVAVPSAITEVCTLATLGPCFDAALVGESPNQRLALACGDSGLRIVKRQRGVSVRLSAEGFG